MAVSEENQDHHPGVSKISTGARLNEQDDGPGKEMCVTQVVKWKSGLSHTLNMKPILCW